MFSFNICIGKEITPEVWKDRRRNEFSYSMIISMVNVNEKRRETMRYALTNEQDSQNRMTVLNDQEISPTKWNPEKGNSKITRPVKSFFFS